MKKFFALNVFLSVLILFSNTGCHISVANEEHVVERIEKTYDVNSGGSLTIALEYGAIDIQTAEQNQVEIVVTKVTRPGLLSQSVEDALADFEVTFSPNDTGLRIEGAFKQGRKYWQRKLNRLEVRFQVTVPKDYNVDLDTYSGRIKVGDLGGTVRAQTSNGNLRFGKIRGSIWGKTSAGSIKVENCDGDVDVQTSAGSIKLESVDGDVNANTSAGSIQAAMTAQPHGECSLRTSAGSIRVTLIPDVTVDVDAETSTGSVSTDFVVTSAIQGKVPRNRLKGSINGGGPLLKLRTSAGSIRLQKAAD